MSVIQAVASMASCAIGICTASVGFIHPHRLTPGFSRIMLIAYLALSTTLALITQIPAVASAFSDWPNAIASYLHDICPDPSGCDLVSIFTVSAIIRVMTASELFFLLVCIPYSFRAHGNMKFWAFKTLFWLTLHVFFLLVPGHLMVIVMNIVSIVMSFLVVTIVLPNIVFGIACAISNNIVEHARLRNELLMDSDDDTHAPKRTCGVLVKYRHILYPIGIVMACVALVYLIISDLDSSDTFHDAKIAVLCTALVISTVFVFVSMSDCAQRAIDSDVQDVSLAQSITLLFYTCLLCFTAMVDGTSTLKVAGAVTNGVLVFVILWWWAQIGYHADDQKHEIHVSELMQTPAITTQIKSVFKDIKKGVYTQLGQADDSSTDTEIAMTRQSASDANTSDDPNDPSNPALSIAYKPTFPYIMFYILLASISLYLIQPLTMWASIVKDDDDDITDIKTNTTLRFVMNSCGIIVLYFFTAWQWCQPNLRHIQ